MTGTARPFSVDPVLTALAVSWQNPMGWYIADKVLPRVRVGDEQYKYDYFPKEQLLTVPNTTVGRRGRVKQTELASEQRTGSVLDRGIDVPEPNSDIATAARQRAAGNTGYDPEARAVEAGKQIVMIDREQRAAAVTSDPDNYEADKKEALAGTAQWSDPDSDPTDDVLRAADSTFLARPNIGIMGRLVWTKLRQNPKVIKALNGNDGDSGVAMLQRLADLWELEELIVGDSQVNVARPGRDPTIERVWGNFFALQHRNPAASPGNGLPTFGITAELPISGNSPWFSARIPDPDMGLEGGQKIRTGEKVEEHIVAASSGYLFTNVIAEA